MKIHDLWAFKEGNIKSRCIFEWLPLELTFLMRFSLPLLCRLSLSDCTHLAGVHHAVLESGAEEALPDDLGAAGLVEPRLTLLVGDDPHPDLHQLRGNVTTWERGDGHLQVRSQ